MQSGVDRGLIFDLGMHVGLDTKFYLDKGFRVVAVEAAPAMLERAQAGLGAFAEGGQLIVVDRALWEKDDAEIAFFFNSAKDDWSSVFAKWAGKGGHEVEEIRVRTLTLPALFDAYGVPYYVKCDVEGCDDIFVRQLLADRRRPAFVSVEAASLDLLAILFAAGYDRFQLVNQGQHWSAVHPEPPREGRRVPVRFNGLMSGLFGRELPPERWATFTEMAGIYLDFAGLKRRYQSVVHGWLDFHATTAATLAAAVEPLCEAAEHTG